MRVDRRDQQPARRLPAWDSRAELFGDPRRIAAGVWAPRGKGTTRGRRDRRVRPLALLQRDPALRCLLRRLHRRTAARAPERHRAIPLDELEILDTWHTLGLRGTGSHDAVAEELFVPADRVISLFDGPVVDRPLYRFPPFGYFALSIGAAALGNARGAIDEFAELAAHKVGQGSSRTLAERSATQAAVAEAEASLRAARALYYEAIEAAWEAARAGAGPGRAAQRPPSRGHARGSRVRRRRPLDLRPRRRTGDLRRLAAAAALPRRAHRDRPLPGQRGVARASGTVLLGQ